MLQSQDHKLIISWSEQSRLLSGENMFYYPDKTSQSV